MAGFGRTLVRGLGAAMQGYGKTLTDQSEEQRRARELDGAVMRQQALATFQHGLSLDTVAQTAAANVAQHEATARIDTREAAARLGPATQAKIKVDEADNSQKFKIWKSQQSIEFNNKLSLEQQRQAFEMAKQDDQQAHDTAIEGQREQNKLDTTPILTLEAADGTPVQFFGVGAKNRKTRYVGGRLPAKQPFDPLGLGAGDTPAPARRGPAPQAAAEPSAPPKDYTIWNGLKAEAATHPAFQGMSAADRLKKVRELAQAQGIAIPPDETF